MVVALRDSTGFAFVIQRYELGHIAHKFPIRTGLVSPRRWQAPRDIDTLVGRVAERDLDFAGRRHASGAAILAL